MAIYTPLVNKAGPGPGSGSAALAQDAAAAELSRANTKLGLIADLTEAREDYRALAQGIGHPGLAGWLLSMANRRGAQVDKFLAPPKAPTDQERAQGPEQGQAGQGAGAGLGR
jgi:hypothetical protein